MSDTCIWGSCGRTARWQISLKIWALATAPGRRTEKNCLRMLSGVTICDECRGMVKAQDFLLPEGRERIATGIARAGGAMPDFASAEIEFVPIVDKPVDIEQVHRDAKRRGASIIEA